MVETQDNRRTQFVRMTGSNSNNIGNIFHIIKNKGLNVDLVSWADRATEAWAFGKDLILDSTGRPVKQTKSLVKIKH